MLILALDTASSLCAVCVFDTASGTVLHDITEDLGTGHAVRLMPMIDEALQAAGATLRDIGLLACSIGPGSFTGVRVGVAAARGLMQATGVAGRGVSTLQALAMDAVALAQGRPVRVLIDARRACAHAQDFGPDGAPLNAPVLLALEDASLGEEGFALAGSGAALVTRDALLGHASTGSVSAFARLAALPVSQSGGLLPQTSLTISPLYLRGADAKRQEGFALARR
jgi:tRNA threonylcarbamoyladenosine biosynthesis protein TsaB